MKESEAAFMAWVTSTAAWAGWRWMHIRPMPNRGRKGWQTGFMGTMGKGWVDLTLVHDKKRRVIFVELKSDTGRVEPEQRELLEYLTAAGQEAYLWRPKDRSEISRILGYEELT